MFVIKVALNNEILKRISAIDENRFSLSTIELPPVTKNRLRKNSKKRSSYASNKIEGNPLTEKQADEVIERDEHKHFLKPEQEIRNYFLALTLLEEKLKKIAVEAYKAVKCRGVTRVDFMVSPLGRCYVLELNTSPGFTSHSLVPKSGMRTGLTFAEVCDKILSLAATDQS